jgi:hypothetical protein
MTVLSWREQQKTFFAEKDIEFEQDQRIIDWLVNATTYAHGENYFDKYFSRTVHINEAEQALIFIKIMINVETLTKLLSSFVSVPRVCISINKFLIYTDTFEDVNEDYDLALLDYIKSIFVNRTIEYHYIPNVKGAHFNFASPTTQFFIT